MWSLRGGGGGYAMATLDHYYGMNVTHARVQWIMSISFLESFIICYLIPMADDPCYSIINV